MEAWILFLVAAFVLVGVLFRKQIKGWFKDEPKEETPEPPKEEEPEEEEPVEEQPEPVEPEEPTEENPSDPIEEPELPPVEPEPETPKEPTEENPVVAQVKFGTVHLTWLPFEGNVYGVQERSGYSYIHVHPSSQGMKNNEYVDTGRKAEEEIEYRIYRKDEAGEKHTIGTLNVKIPVEEKREFVKLPEGMPENVKYFDVIVDDSEEDQTASIQKQLNAIPNGTKDQYHVVRIKNNGKQIWAEGDMKNNPRGYKNILTLTGREFLVITGEGDELVDFKTKAPAVSMGGSVNGNSFSLRKHFELVNSNNIIFKNIRWEGGNTIEGQKIGGSSEMTPDWWWQPFVREKNRHVPFWYIYSREEELLAGRELPEEIVSEEMELIQESLYIAFLKENLKEKELVPSHKDSGAVGKASVWEEEWEQEHGFAVEGCSDIRFENCHVYGVFGDGFYSAKTQKLELLDCTVDMAGRQSYGFADGAKDSKMFECKARHPRRAALDFEPDSNGVIDNMEIGHCYLDNHISAGGTGEISNIYIHDTHHAGSVHILGEAHENRKNWRFSDNTMIGGHGSPNYYFNCLHIKDPQYLRNKSYVNTNQGRLAALFEGCSGLIPIQDNDWTNPSISILRDAKPGTEIIWKNNTPGSVLVIIDNGETKEVKGLETADPELVTMLRDKYKLID